MTASLRMLQSVFMTASLRMFEWLLQVHSYLLNEAPMGVELVTAQCWCAQVTNRPRDRNS